jgi:hypothetical protein
MISYDELTDEEVRLAVRIAEAQHEQGSLDWFEGRIRGGEHMQQIRELRLAKAEYRRRLARRRRAGS